ncbi:hypothetical protein EOM86_05040, partial [Candidatus Nomurabacteria bacterium]|nr:hypothetical protein [Candidatus Nomurabacteria bacterium]
MTHRRVSVRSVLIVGRGSIRRRFARIISVSVVIALALCALAVVKGINDLGDRVSDDVNVSYLDSDLITLYYPRTANQGYLETPFDDDEVVNGLRVKYGFREIVPVYMMNEPWLISRGSRTCEGVVKQVNIDEFFEQRIMSFDIEGRFPESDDEIILAEDAAEMLFDGECIGGKVMLNDGMGSGVEMTVVGVNRTVNPFDKVYSVVSSGKVRELVVKQLDFALENRMELYAFKDESDFQEIQVDTG